MHKKEQGGGAVGEAGDSPKETKVEEGKESADKEKGLIGSGEASSNVRRSLLHRGPGAPSNSFLEETLRLIGQKISNSVSSKDEIV